MTIHYHGTPITPRTALLALAGRHFCVSYRRPDDAAMCHQIGQSVLLDNGAFSYWRAGSREQPYGEFYDDQYHFRGYRAKPLYGAYIDWAEKWCDYKTTWCIIPDAIDAGAEQNDNLLQLWPKSLIGKAQAAPVWHLDEPIDRLRFLIKQNWQRICIGSAGRFATVGSDSWRRRMDLVFNRISDPSGRVPVWLHMLRGMAAAQWGYPFSSVDSTDVARNHSSGKDPAKMAARWDSVQCPPRWHAKMEQLELPSVAATGTVR